MSRKYLAALAVLASAAPFAACDSLGLNDDQRVTVSFATPAAARTQSSVLAADSFTDGTHTINLTNVDVVLDEVTLERSEHEVGGDSDGESDADSDSDGSANERLRDGPFTVALPMNGGVITPIDRSLPAGSYEKIEMDVASVRVRGTYDGQAFDVSLPVNAELELEFDEEFVVDDDADRLNLTVQFDFASWFRNNGALVDPRLLATNGSLRALVINRIRSSIKAFEDSDKDADDEDSDSDSR
jgi:hypothetical protein